MSKYSSSFPINSEIILTSIDIHDKHVGLKVGDIGTVLSTQDSGTIYCRMHSPSYNLLGNPPWPLNAEQVQLASCPAFDVNYEA